MQHFRNWIVLGIVSLTSIASAGEWPKWLGPDGTGISTDKIVDQWPADGPKKLWSQKVGLGFSSLVGLNGKVYFVAMQGTDDVLTAMDAETGNVLWTQKYTVTHKAEFDQAMNPANRLPLPEATPTIDGDRIFTYGGGGDLVGRNLADGKELWHLNVLDETGAKILSWNEASSPLVTPTMVCVQGGKGGAVAIAVDKNTGKVLWKSETGLGGYAAPIIADVGGKSELIVFGGNTLLALDPGNGTTIWKQAWETQYDVNACTPIYHDGKLFISTSYGHGCAMLTVNSTDAKLDWQGKQISAKYQPCILDNGKLYGNSNGILKCLSWPTSKQVWSTREVKLGEGGSFVINGNQLIALSESGTLTLVHLEADVPKVVADFEIFPRAQYIWSAPVIYHGKLYVKGKDELVCLDIAAK